VTLSGFKWSKWYKDGDTSAAARLQPFKQPFATLPETLSTSYGYKNQEEQAG